MKQSVKSMLMSGFMLCSFNAMSDGRLEGRVSDAAGKVFFDGAVVRIKELNMESSSEKGGRFLFNSVPAGNYTLIVDYLGAESVQRQVSISDDQSSVEMVAIGDDVGALENVLVVGQAAGAHNALNKQRAADNFKSIVSSDSIGQFPDENVSEALQRIPGVFIHRDQGEGRFVGVRGMSPTYNSSTINGLSIPAPESDTRAVALDVIPSGLVESLEVTKSLTPDMDADSIGGNIEVKSLSAFDRDGMSYKLSAEAIYSDQAESTTPKIAGTFTNSFETSAGDFGVAAAISYQERDSATEGVESEWHDNGAIKENEVRGYEVTRSRIGLALNLEYRPDDLNEYYVKTLYSDFEDEETSPRAKAEFNDDGTLDEMSFKLKERKETQTIQSVVVGGENIVDEWTYEYSAGYSHAQEDEPFRRETKYEVDPATLARTLDKTELEDNITEDEEVSVRFDVTREMYFGDHPGYIKAGAKLRRREKFNDANIIVTDDNGDLEANDTELGSALDYEINEDINAFYLMSRVDIDDLRVVYGLRYEDTKTSLDGFNVILDEGAADEVVSVPVSYSKDYSHVLPSINLRYRASDAMILRAAFTQSISRPGFGEMNPTPEKLEIDGLDVEIEAGNPDLDPLESNNFDASFEYYSDDLGTFGVGVFYKDIENFIYTADVRDSINLADYLGAGFNPALNVDEAIQYKNGDSAEVYGLELNYTRNFEGALSGFLVQANATVSDSDAQLTDDNRDISLPGQSDFVANLTLGYEAGPLSLRLSAAHTGKRLEEVGETKAFDVYEDDRTQIDLTAKYDIDENLQVFFNAINITDEEQYFYYGSSSRNKQDETYGPTFSLGLTYRNF